MEAQEDLGEDQAVEGIVHEEDRRRACDQGDANTEPGMRVLGIIRFTKHPGKDAPARHAGSDAGSNAGKQEGDSEYQGGNIPQQGPEHRFGLNKIGDDCAVPEKYGGRNQNHRTVDPPTDKHGKKGIQKFILQLVVDNRLILDLPLPALDDLRMEKKVVGHDHGPEHAHDNRDRPLRQARHDPANDGLGPHNRRQHELENERQTDERDKADDVSLQQRIGIS